MPFALLTVCSLQSGRERDRQTFEEEVKAAFPTVRQGAGKVGFPVDIFGCFHPGSRRTECPVLSVLAACQCLVEQWPCNASLAFFTGVPVSDTAGL